MSKTYKSPVKLDRLGEDAAVRFEGSLDRWYKKSDGKWSRYNWMGKDIMAFPSKTLVNYHNGRPFEIIREGKK